MKYILSLLALVGLSFSSFAQDQEAVSVDTAKSSKGSGGSISIGSGGFKYKKGKDSTRHFIDIQYGMLDIGVNTLNDNTDYSSAAARNYLQVSSDRQNGDLFSLRTAKSINVNVYPVMIKANLLRTRGQKILLSTGLGLQLYNFRFTKPVRYYNDPQPYVTLDTISFTKNKLAMNYLTVPLMITAKTRLGGGPGIIGEKGGSGRWLVYGVGVSGGYLLQSWTKQKSDERGKDKTYDQFNFRSTNLCVNGEIGLDGLVRLFASYQLTSLHENALDQHPVSVGIRFFGL